VEWPSPRGADCSDARIHDVFDGSESITDPGEAGTPRSTLTYRNYFLGLTCIPDALYHYSDTVKNKLLRLDPSSGLPIYLQLVDQIKHAVEICAITPGDQLPSVRMLAHDLVISPNTVVKAYTELAFEGIVELRQGAGAFIVDQERKSKSVDMLLDAKLDVHGLVARFRGRGLSDGEIRRLFEAELLTTEESLTKRGRRT